MNEHPELGQKIIINGTVQKKWLYWYDDELNMRNNPQLSNSILRETPIAKREAIYIGKRTWTTGHKVGGSLVFYHGGHQNYEIDDTYIVDANHIVYMVVFNDRTNPVYVLPSQIEQEEED